MIRYKHLKIKDLLESKTGKSADFKFGSVWPNSLLRPTLSMLSEVASPLSIFNKKIRAITHYGRSQVARLIPENRDIWRGARKGSNVNGANLRR